MLAGKSLASVIRGALVLWACILGPSIAVAEEAAGSRLALTTAYLTEPFGWVHRLTIHAALPCGGLLAEQEKGCPGELLLDPNTCTLTEFGDPEICTRIALTPVAVTIVRLRLGDPTGQNRPIYEIRGRVPPSGSKYMLVVPPETGGAYRLVVTERQEGKRTVIVLEEASYRTGESTDRP